MPMKIKTLYREKLVILLNIILVLSAALVSVFYFVRIIKRLPINQPSQACGEDEECPDCCLPTDCPTEPPCKPTKTPTPTSTLIPTETPIPTPTLIPTPTSEICPSPTPTETEMPPSGETPIPTPTDTVCETPTPTISEESPSPSPSVTLTPTVTEEVQPTPTATEIPSPTPTAETPTSTPQPESGSGGGTTEEKKDSGAGGGITQGIIETTKKEAVSSEENYNPLVEGIRKSFGFILGAATLPWTGAKDDPSLSSKLPSGNNYQEGDGLFIPKIGLNVPLYQAIPLGNELLVGDQEILESDSGLIYGHNNSETFGLIGNLNVGETIIKTENGRLYRYRVNSVFWVGRQRAEILNTPDGQITLVTCDHNNPDLRVVVRAVLETI